VSPHRLDLLRRLAASPDGAWVNVEPLPRHCHDGRNLSLLADRGLIAIKRDEPGRKFVGDRLVQLTQLGRERLATEAPRGE